MTASTRQLDCPDPHNLRPTQDSALWALERRLVAEFRDAAPERAPLLDAALQAYVDYLHALGCSPEHVVLHIKRRLDDATADTGPLQAYAARAAIITRAIEVYFGAP